MANQFSKTKLAAAVGAAAFGAGLAAPAGAVVVVGGNDGWEVSFDHKNRPFYGHTGNGVGGYAFFRIYPAQQMVFSILVNVTAPGIDKEIRIITDRIIDAAAGKK